jgi:NDP-sugar pyrophosphorylase family protein
MAGKSSRFLNAGFTLPKFMLTAHGRSLFEHSLLSFKNYFDNEDFLFICINDKTVIDFVKEKAKFLDIKNFHLVCLDEVTRGQAETVYLGLKKIVQSNNMAFNLSIFNIDTFRVNFKHPDLNTMEDGYLEVFEGEGDNWSFAKPKESNSTLVAETAEKNPISNLCSTGLYFFKDYRDFLTAFEKYQLLPKESWERGELYIAPLYNLLIKNDKNIHYRKILRSEVIFFGVPEEYYAFLKESQI